MERTKVFKRINIVFQCADKHWCQHTVANAAAEQATCHRQADCLKLGCSASSPCQTASLHDCDVKSSEIRPCTSCNPLANPFAASPAADVSSARQRLLCYALGCFVSWLTRGPRLLCGDWP